MDTLETFTLTLTHAQSDDIGQNRKFTHAIDPILQRLLISFTWQNIAHINNVIITNNKMSNTFSLFKKKTKQDSYYSFQLRQDIQTVCGQS